MRHQPGAIALNQEILGYYEEKPTVQAFIDDLITVQNTIIAMAARLHQIRTRSDQIQIWQQENAQDYNVEVDYIFDIIRIHFDNDIPAILGTIILTHLPLPILVPDDHPIEEPIRLPMEPVAPESDVSKAARVVLGLAGIGLLASGVASIGVAISRIASAPATTAGRLVIEKAGEQAARQVIELAAKEAARKAAQQAAIVTVRQMALKAATPLLIGGATRIGVGTGSAIVSAVARPTR